MLNFFKKFFTKPTPEKISFEKGDWVWVRRDIYSGPTYEIGQISHQAPKDMWEESSTNWYVAIKSGGLIAGNETYMGLVAKNTTNKSQLAS